jgi:alkanesulfonate monooxygenase SsuD/methylene tetrahydromethanopterin reductase-like flavin-dependent oxidoreductase (luciferase family)
MTSNAMSIGLGLPQVGVFADPAITRRVAIEAELAGFDSLWTVDHVVNGAALDPFLALTLAAAVTHRIQLGTGVVIAPLYAPVLLGRSAASLDRISNGRFTLGLGLGRSADDYAAVGLPRHGLQVRIEQVLEVLARVWRDEIVEIETSRETIVPSSIGPKPVHGSRVPLVLATSHPAGLERIARRADGWITTGLPLETVGQHWSTVLQIAQRYGRDLSSLRLVLRADVQVTGVAAGRARPTFTGSIAEIRSDIERARQLGVHEIILDLQSTATTEQQLLDLSFQLTDGSLRSAIHHTTTNKAA